MKLVYFSQVRERLGKAEEELNIPADVETVGALIDYLITLGSTYQSALSNTQMLRVAVNQVYAKRDHAVSNEDEVAIFPPVTGG